MVVSNFPPTGALVGVNAAFDERIEGGHEALDADLLAWPQAQLTPRLRGDHWDHDGVEHLLDVDAIEVSVLVQGVGGDLGLRLVEVQRLRQCTRVHVLGDASVDLAGRLPRRGCSRHDHVSGAWATEDGMYADRARLDPVSRTLHLADANPDDALVTELAADTAGCAPTRRHALRAAGRRARRRQGSRPHREPVGQDPRPAPPR